MVPHAAAVMTEADKDAKIQQLERLLEQKESRIKNLIKSRDEWRVKANHLHYWKSKAAGTKAAIVEQPSTTALALRTTGGNPAPVIYKRGKQGRYFTMKGGMTLALKQCISNAASYSVGLVAGIDCGDKAVRTYQEIRFIRL